MSDNTLTDHASAPVALWMEMPEPAYVGCRTQTPFTLHLSAEYDRDYTVDLYAQNSGSMPYQQPQNKWSQLNPQWRFTDLSGNFIESINMTVANGAPASAQFYYIDDMPTTWCAPVYLWATVDFSTLPVAYDQDDNKIDFAGFSNSKVATVAVVQINALNPHSIRITRNGSDDMLPYYWNNTSIPNVITVNGMTPTEEKPILFYVPVSGTIPDVSRSIVELASAEQVWSPETATISARDEDGFIVGGYARNEVFVNTTVSAASISAAVCTDSVPADFLLQRRHLPYIWVSNPNNNTLNLVMLRYDCPGEDTILNQITSYMDEEKIVNVGDVIKIIDTPMIVSVPIENPMGLTGFGGIYGMAVNPNDYTMIAVDAEMDAIYKFDINGVMISSLDLSSISSDNTGITPAGISLDSNYNFYVAMYDDVFVYKFNKDFEFQYGIVPPDSYPVVYGENIYKPTLAETDKNNDIWVSYNNPLCSCLFKYDEMGSGPLSTIILPVCSCPMDICIDKNNDVWVSLTHHVFSELSGSVKKFSGTDGTELSSLYAIRPEYICTDSTNGIWFTQNYATVTNVNQYGVCADYMAGQSLVFNPLNENAIDGLTVDIYDRVFVINSVENYLYTVIDGVMTASAVEIEPHMHLEWYNDTGEVVALSSASNKSAQAFCDWTGGRWVRKYSNLTEDISGSSMMFEICDDTSLRLRRFNESWDSINAVKGFVLSPHIKENEFFWDKYMASLFGNASSEDLKGYGRESYERISNFVKNHSDVDYCNIPQLYSFANELDVNIDDYNFLYPALLKRLMDIAAVNQRNLWGSRCTCNLNLNYQYMPDVGRYCAKCGHTHDSNRGVAFDPYTYTVSAGVPFVIKDNYESDKYDIVIPPMSGYLSAGGSDICENATMTSVFVGFDTYPLSSNTWLLPSIKGDSDEFIIGRFCFYDFVDVKCGVQVEGLVNWDDESTTYSETLSTTENWYGNDENLEKMISYVLHKGLDLIDG